MPPLATIAIPPSSPSAGLRLSQAPDNGPFAEYHERRRRHRTPVVRAVKLFDPVSGRYFGGHTCDVSESGFCLEMSSRLPAFAGQTACIFIAGTGLNRFAEHTQMMPVRYIWVRRDSSTGIARCGVEILADTASQRHAA